MRGCTNLGNMYRAGGGVAQDFNRAADLYEQACNGGDLRGCNNLGDMYQAGDGITQDLRVP